MKLLAIDTSADDTSVAITDGRRILANERYSQITLHSKWGGIYPTVAKRAHQEMMQPVLNRALQKANLKLAGIDAFAVTYGPGLAPALQIGIDTIKELAKKYKKPLIPVNHLEGHIYSCFAQNSQGNPLREFQFPYLVLLASGGHTELILFHDHVKYEIVGRTLDDASGEALDKAAKMLIGAVYPGGPVIERLALTGDKHYFVFPRPMMKTDSLDFSFAGLKTAFLYHLRKMSEKEKQQHLSDLAASFQEAVMRSMIIKMERAIKKYNINHLCVGGGVSANKTLRKYIRVLTKKYKGTAFFPTYKSLYGDNAAMVGIAGYYKTQKKMFAKNIDSVDRVPRASLDNLEKF